MASTSGSPIALRKSVAIPSAPGAFPERSRRMACRTSSRVAFVFEVSRFCEVWSANVVSVMSQLNILKVYFSEF